MAVEIERLLMKNGGRFDFWIKNLALVEEFIRKFDLKPVDRRYFAEPQTAKAAADLQIEWIDPRGGMRIPHFHFQGKVYLLDHEQWNVFTRHMTSEYREKLAAANAVSFNQLMEMSEVMESLPVAVRMGAAV